MSGLRSSRYLLEAPMVIRMVLAVRKHLKMTKVNILDNFDFKIFSKKTFPGHVQAQVLQEPVCGSHDDQGRISGNVSIWCSS